MVSADVLVPGVGVAELNPEHLDLLEPQMDRQEDAMSSRLSSAGTRANILIGSSAVLGGAELVTSSGHWFWTSLSLVLYAAAAVIGLWSFRSRLGKEPDLPVVIREFSGYQSISMRRELMLGRLRAHETSVQQLNSRHRWLVIGFFVLGMAFLVSAVGTGIGMATQSPVAPTEIRIVE